MAHVNGPASDFSKMLLEKAGIVALRHRIRRIWRRVCRFALTQSWKGSMKPLKNAKLTMMKNYSYKSIRFTEIKIKSIYD